MDSRNVVSSNPKVLGGTPVFTGTRVPVKNLIDYLEGGHSLEEFLDDFPSVTQDQAVAALSVASDAAAQRGQPWVDNTPDPCPTYDSCTMSYTFTSYTGEPISVIRRCKDSTCWVCTEYDRCVPVSQHGICKCDDVKFTEGQPITSCSMQGECYYNA